MMYVVSGRLCYCDPLNVCVECAFIDVSFMEELRPGFSTELNIQKLLGQFNILHFSCLE
ncbi:hypothetical protein LINPERHAP1_LOCUS13330 [Linum perenne]